MDANGSRFQLLLGLTDWERCTADGYPASGEIPLWWDANWSAVRLPSRTFRFPASRADVVPTIDDRRGAGADSFGNWYWIDDGNDGRPSVVRVTSAGSGAVSAFWATGDETSLDPRSRAAGDFAPIEPPVPQPRLLRSLAVTSSHFLVVGVLDPAGLLVFDLHSGGPPRPEVWFPGFAPFDMASAPDGGVWILERATSTAAARLWRLDRRLQVCALSPSSPPPAPERPDFHSRDATPLTPPPRHVPSTPSGPTAAAALTLSAAGDVIAVEALPDGGALLLAHDPISGAALLWRYSMASGLTGPFAPTVRTGLLAESDGQAERGPFTRGVHDLAFVLGDDPDLPPRALPGRLFLVDGLGNQAFAFTVTERQGGTLEVDLLAEYRPMRLFGGRALVAFGDSAYYDSRQDWVPLVVQPRPRYAAQLTVRTPLQERDDPGAHHAFDGRDPDCVWHRLLLDCCLPANTSISVRSRAANSERELAIADWRDEPIPYRRREGTELPYVRQPPARDWGTLETLIQAARGRFLQLEVTLHGDGRSSPRLRALRAYFPRFSYLTHYLPAVYRDDGLSASFLDRFLANLEGTNTAVEDRIAAVRALMDPRSAPVEYLDWLAGWFGAMLDPHWDETRRRLFIAYAPDLFRQRGTVSGMIRAIRLATDACPDESIFTATADELQGVGRPSSVRIIEHFRTRTAPGLIFGDPSGAEGPGLTAEVSTWTPDLGAAPLHQRFQDHLQLRYGTVSALNAAWDEHPTLTDFAAIELPPTRPANATKDADWQRFLRAGLGVPYAPVDADGVDRRRFQDFLARRYVTIDRYKRAYGLAGAATPPNFDGIGMPATIPDAGAPLRDWIQFVSILVPTRRNAHRFSVLVPTLAGPGAPGRSDMNEQIRRVVAIEKPAHTAFDVREYWAAFRVGEARLGFDTIVDQGSRLVPILLGRGELAAGYLGYAHPWSAPGRMVLGQSVPPQRALAAAGPGFVSCPSSPEEWHE